MLTTEEVKTILVEENRTLADEQVIKVRDEINQLADLLLDIYEDKIKKQG